MEYDDGEMKGSPKEWKVLVRMTEQDRLSQASSLATISAFPVRPKDKDPKVHNFGKRARALKRDPNCPVVIRGWLYKQDSSGLKLWKRRWFVLSDFCLFYYKDSREEAVLGSIPLPSYRILFCTPRECKNRKYAFKAVHQGMRSYFFSADTQEDMLGWVRALSQSACMDSEGSLNRRCSSFQDFTQLGGSSESLTFFQMSSLKNGPTQTVMYGNGPQSESCHFQKVTAGTTHMDHEGKQAFSQLPRTSTPTSYGGPRRRGQSLSLEGNEQDGHPFISRVQTPPPIMKSTGSRPLTPKCQLGTRPHTPVGRVDIRPNDDHLLPPQNMGCSPPSPQRESSLSSVTPTPEKRLLKPPLHFSPQPHVSVMRRGPGKACSHGGQTGSLPPLPPPRIAPAPPPPHHHHHHHHHRSPMSVCLLQHAMLPARQSIFLLPPRQSTFLLPPNSLPDPATEICVSRSSPLGPLDSPYFCLKGSKNMDCLEVPEGQPSPADLYQDRDPFRPLELDVDAILTRICGCDKLLQALSKELVQLQADKDNVQCALEMTRLQLDDQQAQGLRGLGVQGKDGLSQKGFLQEELVTVRARLCDISMEMEKVWSQYERMESELSIIRSHLQHICRFGRLQEQSQAQRELWMMEDILCGLRANRNHFRAIMASQRQTVLQKGALHHEAPRPQVDRSPSGIPMAGIKLVSSSLVTEGIFPLAPGTKSFQSRTEVELEPPPRPPLPQEVQESGLRPGCLEREAEVEVFSSDLSSCQRSLDRTGNSLTVLPRGKKLADTMPATLPGFTASSWASSDTATKRARMSEEEQRERIRRNQERLSNQKKEAMPTGINDMQYQRSSLPREEPPFPIRVTRVYTAVLPSALIARRVSVEDPAPELVSPIPQLISTGTSFSIHDQSQKSLFQETLNQNSLCLKPNIADDQPDERLLSDLSSEIFEDRADMSHTAKGLSKQNKQKLAKEEDPSQLRSHNYSSIPSGQSTEAFEEHLKDVAKLETKTGLWSQTNDWMASESGISPSDDGAKVKEGGSGVAGVTLGNGRREKPGTQASLLAAELELDLGLTPEQREAKLKRVERIRERVVKSAARESNMQPRFPSIGGNREHIANLSLKLENKASKKSKGMAACSEVSDECQVTEDLDCGGGCYSNKNPDLGLRVTTKPKPSRIPSITANKGRHILKGVGSLKDAAKNLRKTPIDNHSKSLDVTCHAINISLNQLNTTNNSTTLSVCPRNTDQQSVQKEDNSHPSNNNENETKEEQGSSVSQKSQFNTRRAEWFLSDNHKVGYIPLLNQFKESSSSENTTDQGNTYSHLMWQPTMMTSNHIECLQFPSKQKVSEVDISAVSPDFTGKMEHRSIDPMTDHVPAHQSLVQHAQSSPTADNLIYEIKNSNESAASILEGTTSEKTTHEIFEQSNKKPVLSPSLANGENQNIQSNEKQDYTFTDDIKCTEFLGNQTTPTYATIHFIAPALSDINQDKENNTFLTVHSESQSDPQNTSADQMTSSLTKSIKDLHIYEEISFNSTPSQLQPDHSHNTVLTDNQFTSSCYLQSVPSENLPDNLSAHSISTSQRGEKEIEKENTDSDWPDKSLSEGQTDLEAAKGSLGHSEVRTEAPFGKDIVSYNSEINDKKDNQGSEFVMARVTVVRTSL